MLSLRIGHAKRICADLSVQVCSVLSVGCEIVSIDTLQRVRHLRVRDDLDADLTKQFSGKHVVEKRPLV